MKLKLLKGISTPPTIAIPVDDEISKEQKLYCGNFSSTLENTQ